MLPSHFQFILYTSRSMPSSPTLGQTCSKCGFCNCTSNRKHYKLPFSWLLQIAYWKATGHPPYTKGDNPHITATPQGRSSKVLPRLCLCNLWKSIFCAAVGSSTPPKNAIIWSAVGQPVRQISCLKASAAIGIPVVLRRNYRPMLQAYKSNAAVRRQDQQQAGESPSSWVTLATQRVLCSTLFQCEMLHL